MPELTQPNVLFLFTDDQRFDTIAGLGLDPAVKTPNLDRLVARGTAFTNAYIMGGSCPAVCMPSRAMLHTGRSLWHIEGIGRSIAADHTTMGEAFAAAGYQTWGCGKWHNGMESFNRSFADGDEIFFGGMMDHWNVPVHHYDPSGEYATQLPACVHALTTKELHWRHADHIQAGKHSSELLGDAACRFIEDADRDRPFFAYVSFLAPHDPRTMPEKFQAMFDPDAIELPPNYMPVHPFDNGELAIRDEKLAGFPRTEKEVREHIADYYAMIAHLDFEIGRILDALEASGEAENTIIVMAGDNGLAVGQHGLMGKQNMYEHSVHVPLVMAGPGVPQGERCEAWCYLIDIFPTLCELAGIETPASVEGQSLVAAMAGDEPGRDALYFGYMGLQRSVRIGRHKLIEYHVDGHRRTQLFDVEDDPRELKDLSNDPAMQEKVTELRSKLRAMADAYDDDQEGQGATFWDGWDDARR